MSDMLYMCTLTISLGKCRTVDQWSHLFTIFWNSRYDNKIKPMEFNTTLTLQ